MSKWRFGLSVLVVLVLGAASGCGWSNDDATPYVGFELATENFSESRALGEMGQDDLVSNRIAAAEQSFNRSTRFAELMNISDDWSTDQIQFVQGLKELQLSWTAVNSRALRAVENGDGARSREILRNADLVEARIDDFIAKSDIEGLSDGRLNEADIR